jgi:hypothetical protein
MINAKSSDLYQSRLVLDKSVLVIRFSTLSAYMLIRGQRAPDKAQGSEGSSQEKGTLFTLILMW